MELLAQEEGQDPIPQNSTIADLITMGLPKEEAEELTTAKCHTPEFYRSCGQAQEKMVSRGSM